MSHKAYKVRLYPTKKQEILILKTFGGVRFMFNQMLAERRDFYQENKDNKEILKSHKYRTEKEIKEEFTFLKEVSSRALQQARIDLTAAYRNFFKGTARFPKFKSKRFSRRSYREPQVRSSIKLIGNRVKLLKLGKVKYRGLPDEFQWDTSDIKSATISQDPDGKFYCSLLCEIPSKTSPREAGNSIGIDLGLKDFVTCSNADQIVPLNTSDIDYLIRKQQKHLSRKERGSNRYNKARIKLAKLNKKRSDKVTYFFRHLALKLCSENQTIKIEDLNVKGMKKNRKLSGAIHSVSWGKFLEILAQKAVQFGCDLIKVDRWFPSSKLCSCCGNKKDDLKLSDRIYYCESCGLKMNRDLNAAINILNYNSGESPENIHRENVRLIRKSFDLLISGFVEV